MSGRDHSIQSVEATLDVVESFLVPNGGVGGVTEIARLTGLKKNRVWRILTTLTQRGYVVQDPSTSQYSLGPGFLVLGEAFRDRLDLRRLAEPLLIDLATETGDVAFLFVRFGHQAVCTDMQIGRHSVQALARLGEPIPLHIGAAPKVLLAFLPDTEQAEIIAGMELSRYTARTITSRHALAEELDKIRAQGYCVAEDDYELDANAVGAPVWDHRGSVVAAISLATTAGRYGEQRRDRAIELVLDAAQRLSEKLGYRGVFSGVESENQR